MASSSSSHNLSLTLHGLSESARDVNASGTSGSRRIWNKPATTINVPTNSRSGQSIANGPYSNVSDTLSRPTGNIVAARTFLGVAQPAQPALKRRKINTDIGIYHPGPRSRPRPNKVLLAPESHNPVIDLVNDEGDEDEDLGLPLSSTSKLTQFITPPETHPFDKDKGGVAVPRTRAEKLEFASSKVPTQPRQKGMSPSSREWLEKLHGRSGAKGEDETDQIASFSDDPPAPQSRLRGGKVIDMAHRIDAGSGPKPMPPQSDPQFHRSIDLRKTKMKGKSGPLLRTVPTKDAKTVSLTPISKTNTRDDILFPVKKLHFTGKTYENTHIKYEPENGIMELLIDKASTKYFLKAVNPRVKVSDYPNFVWTQKDPLIAFYLDAQEYESPFFMIFEEDCHDWKPTAYADMVQHLKKGHASSLVRNGRIYIESKLSHGLNGNIRERANGFRPRDGNPTTLKKPRLQEFDDRSSSPDLLACGSPQYPPSDDEVHEVPNNGSGPSTSTKGIIRPRNKRNGGSASTSVAVRRSTRQVDNSNIETHETLSPIENPEELVLVYPWGSPGAVNLNRGDLGRLRPSQFLNDNLIEFGLKLWLTELERTKPEVAQDVHLFSPFFYGKLKFGDGYQNVRRWTSKVDIFKKKYLIVPINENYHWYLAIIYHPEHVLREPPEVQSPSTRARTRRSSLPPEAPPEHMMVDETTEEETHNLDELGQTSTVTRPPSPAETLSGASPDAVESLTRLSQTLDLKERDDSRPTTPSPVQDAMNSSPLTSVPSSPVNLPPRPLELDVNMSDDDCIMFDATEMPRKLSPTLSDMGPKSIAISDDSTNAVVGDDTPKDFTANPPIPPQGIPPEQFYGSGRPKRKLNVLDSPGVEIVESHKPPRSYGKKDKGKQVERTPKVKEAPRDMTYIITFDSLGSKHPKVCTTLAEYLRLEAKDKLNLDKTTKAQGKQALVPVQPNFSDCGLYLIHFTTTFMSNPEYYYNLLMTQQLSLAQKKTEWKETSISSMREQMIAQAERLGEEWRVWKEQKEKEEKEKPREESMAADVDSDVDIVDVTVDVPEAGRQKGKGRGGGGGKAKKS